MSEKPQLTNPDDQAAESQIVIPPEEVQRRIEWQKERQDARLHQQQSDGKLPPMTHTLRRYMKKVFGK